MTTRLWDENELDRIPWNDSENHTLVRQWMAPYMRNGSATYVANADARICIIEHYGLMIPVSINEGVWTNTFIVSSYTLISELRDKLKNLPRAIRWVLTPAFFLVGRCLKIRALNNVVMLYNFLVTTNLYPPHLPKLRELTEFVERQFPGKALIWRSLNTKINASCLKDLDECGYRRIVNRQVWLFEKPLEHHDKRTRKTLREDQKLFESTRYSIKQIEEFTDEEVEQIKGVYTQLYLKKYSYFNPQLTSDFFRLLKHIDQFKVMGILDDGRIIAAVAFFAVNNVMTTPVVGYDLDVPQKDGLYRLLTYVCMSEAKRQGYILNHSSGVGHFKRGRGARGTLEWNMVYIEHLAWYDRLIWTSFIFFRNRLGLLIIKRFNP